MLAFNARSVTDNSGQDKIKAKATETPVGTHIGQAHPNAPGVQNTSRDPNDPIQTAAYPLIAFPPRGFHHEGEVAPNHQNSGRHK
jgi:hypothetical protein